MAGRLQRTLQNNPRVRQDTISDAARVFDSSLPVSKKPNAAYGADDFHRIMVMAAVLGISIGGYAAAVRRIVTVVQGLGRSHRCAPCSEWMRDICSRIDSKSLMQSFNEMISMQVSQLEDLGMLGNRRMNVAIDMHLIPRWDRKHGAELVRSKAKRGTHLFERYITVQCVTRRIQLTLGAHPMPALTDTADFVRKTIDSCLEKKVRIGIAMLDREFFSTDVIRTIDGMGIRYLMPCINTASVTCAIEEFACGRRLAASRFRITKSKHDYAEYTMIITKRTRKRKTGKPEKPEEKYIAFATNMPGINVDYYARRWMIETGYRMAEKQRAKTRSKNETIRALCFLYTLILYNTWVIANARLTSGLQKFDRVYAAVTQTDVLMVRLINNIPWYLVRQKPPPDARCNCMAGGGHHDDHQRSVQVF